MGKPGASASAGDDRVCKGKDGRQGRADALGMAGHGQARGGGPTRWEWPGMAKRAVDGQGSPGMAWRAGETGEGRVHPIAPATRPYRIPTCC